MSSLLTAFAKALIPLSILAAGIGGFAVLAASRTPPAPKDVSSKPPLVKTIPVAEKLARLDIEADGTVVPLREITISSQVEGRIVEHSPNLREGRFVEKGDVLLRVESRDYDLEIERLEAELGEKQTQLEELKVEIENTEDLIDVVSEELTIRRREVARQQQLQQRGAGTATGLEEAQRNEIQARNSLTTLQNQAKLLKARKPRLKHNIDLVSAQLEKARLDLQRTTITAPIDGLLVTNNCEENGYLRVGDEVAVIEDVSEIEITCYLEMRAVSWLRTHPPEGWQPPEGPEAAYAIPETPVTVSYDVLGTTYLWDGVLSRYEGSGVDTRTRTVPCRVRVKNPRAVSERGNTTDFAIAAPAALVRGMFVEVNLHTAPRDPVLTVPEKAVRPGNVVWILRDGKLQIHRLPIAQISGDDVLIPPETSPIRPGDRLIVSPLPVPTPGMELREEPLDAEVQAVADDATRG